MAHPIGHLILIGPLSDHKRTDLDKKLWKNKTAQHSIYEGVMRACCLLFLVFSASSASAQQSCLKIDAQSARVEASIERTHYPFRISNRCDECVEFWIQPRRNGQSFRPSAQSWSGLNANPAALGPQNSGTYTMSVDGYLGGTYGPSVESARYC